MDKQFTKVFRAPLVFKVDGDAGTVTAVISTFGVVDKDLDVVLPTAFTHGQAVPMCWSHDWSQPVGRGSIAVEPDRAIFNGHFFLDTQAGKEAYATCKAMAELQEWSWGFQVLDSSYETRDGKAVRVIKQAQVFEVSPVLVGAGENTRTLAIKAAVLESKSAVPFKATAKADEGEAWSAPALKDFTDKAWGDLTDAEIAKITACFAWTANEPPTAFGDLKLPHHNPDGAVVWNGVAGCAQRLGQAQIPAGDMAGVRAHIRGHYEQFGKDVPETLKEAAPGERKQAVDFVTAMQDNQTEEQIWDAHWQIERAWSDCVDNILTDDALDLPGKLALLQASAGQYVQALIAWAARGLAATGGELDAEMMGANPSEHKGQPLNDQAKAALAAAEAVVARFKALAADLAKEGRAISQTRLDRMGAVRDQMRQMADELDAMMTEANPPKALSADYLERRLRASALSLAILN